VATIPEFVEYEADSVSSLHPKRLYHFTRVYPQEAINPNYLHNVFWPELKSENEYHIAKLICGKELTLYLNLRCDPFEADFLRRASRT
jgi:hypothetical protein